MLSIPLPLQTESPSTEASPNQVTSLESKDSIQTPLPEQQSTSTSKPLERSIQEARPDGAKPAVEEPTPKRLLTDEDIAALKTVVQPQQQQAAPQKELTQDEIDKLLHVWKPDAKWYERLSAGGDEAMKAVNEMQQGLMAQSARRTQLELMQLRAELQPGLVSAQNVAASAEEAKFYADHKDLAPHKDVVEFIYGKLNTSGKLAGMSPSQMYKAVADETRAYAKSKGMALVSTPASAGQKQTIRKVPAQLNGVSQTGGGSSSSADSPAMAALRRIG